MACGCSTAAAAASRRPRPAGSCTALTTRLFALQDEARALLAGEQALTRGHLRIAADSAHHVVPIMAALRKRAEALTFALVDRQLRRRARAAAAPRGRRRRDGQERVGSAPACRPPAHRPAGAVRAGAPCARQTRPRAACPRSPARSWCCASAARSRAKCLNRRWPLPTYSLAPSSKCRPARACARRWRQASASARCSPASSARTGAFVASWSADTDLNVAEYAVSLQERRRVALVRAFMDEATRLAS